MSFVSLARPLVPALRSAPRVLPALRLEPRSSYASWRDEQAAKWKDEDQIEEARRWLRSFTLDSIPRRNCVVTHSQSSGPGGQNVNKLSTKATLHLDLTRKADFLPAFILKKVRENSRHLTKDDSIVVQCDESRKQPENTELCFQRLYKIIRSAVDQDVPGETSPEKKQRVAKLQREERTRRRALKDMQKSKKSARRSKGGDL